MLIEKQALLNAADCRTPCEPREEKEGYVVFLHALARLICSFIGCEKIQDRLVEPMGQHGHENESGKQRDVPMGTSLTAMPILPDQAAKEAEKNQENEDALAKAADLQRKLDELEETLEELAKGSEPPVDGKS